MFLLQDIETVCGTKGVAKCFSWHIRGLMPPCCRLQERLTVKFGTLRTISEGFYWISLPTADNFSYTRLLASLSLFTNIWNYLIWLCTGIFELNELNLLVCFTALDVQYHISNKCQTRLRTNNNLIISQVGVLISLIFGTWE